MWIQNFILRCQHFAALSTLTIQQLRTSGVWLGGLLHPEAFIIAMRQLVAQENGWSLNDVQLNLVPLTTEQFERCGEVLQERKTAFLIHSLVLEGGLVRRGTGAVGRHSLPAGRGAVRVELREGEGGGDDSGPHLLERNEKPVAVRCGSEAREHDSYGDVERESRVDHLLETVVVFWLCLFHE